MNTVIALTLALVFLATSASAQRFYQIRSVHDADTFKLVGIKKPVRLLGINAAEVKGAFGRKAEPYGYESRTALLDLLGCMPTPTKADGEAVRCTHAVRLGFEPKSRVDRCDNRVLFYIYRDDGLFVDLELVRTGNARYDDRFYTRYAADLNAAQDEARAKSLGMWTEAYWLLFWQQQQRKVEK